MFSSAGPDCIPVVVLKNCEPGPSYVLVEFFNMCLKRIARAFSRPGTTPAVALNISKAFGKVWHAGLHKLKSYVI